MKTILAPPLLQSMVQAPVLEFPEAGIDDPAVYAGYATRFFRETAGNAFQVYFNAALPCGTAGGGCRTRGRE